MQIAARTAAWAKSPDQYKDIAFHVVIPEELVGFEFSIQESGTSTRDSVGYVDWGDGAREEYLNTSRSWRSKYFYHAYSTPGEYVVQCLPNQLWNMSVGASARTSNKLRDCTDAILKIDPSVECKIDYFMCEAAGQFTIPKFVGKSGNVRSAIYAFSSGAVVGDVPVFGEGIANMQGCFQNSSITGSIPKLPDSVTTLDLTFYQCTGITGNIPPWPTACVSAKSSYYHTSLTGTWIDWPGDFSLLTPEQIEELMPSRITEHTNAVNWNSNDFRRFFYAAWGGLQPDPA